MSESNHTNSEVPDDINTESDKFGIFVNQTYETAEGNKFLVTSIARESGNIEDFFVVYKNIPQQDSQGLSGSSDEEQGLGKTEQSWVRNMAEIESLENFDDIEYPTTDKIHQLELESSKAKEDNEEAISIGQKYQHFKTRDFYIIKDVARDPTDPGKKFVIYEGQYNSPEFGDHPVWIREYEDFTGMKVFKDDELDGNGRKKEPIKRFTLIDQNTQ